jgi:hypothetical protein
MTEPQDPAVAGSDRLRAGHADREQVIEALKNAFTQGRLTGEELGARTRADRRTHISWPHRSPSSGRGAQVPRGIRPVSDAT